MHTITHWYWPWWSNMLYSLTEDKFDDQWYDQITVDVKFCSLLVYFEWFVSSFYFQVAWKENNSIWRQAGYNARAQQQTGSWLSGKHMFLLQSSRQPDSVHANYRNLILNLSHHGTGWWGGHYSYVSVTFVYLVLLSRSFECKQM